MNAIASYHQSWDGKLAVRNLTAQRAWRRLGVVLGACALCAGGLALRAEDSKLAWSFAQSGISLAAQGKDEQARALFYRALATDPNCPDALFELARIFDKENQPAAAADFYVRAKHYMVGKDEKDSTYVSRCAEADRRLKSLNPYAARFQQVMEEYAKELEGIAKRSPDSMTRTEALDRVSSLNLRDLIAPDKMPKIEALTPAARAAANSDGGGVAGLSPEVERALKKAGWTTITGSWVKKAEDVYEVTDGKLTTDKLDGAVQVVVRKSPATVSVLVRNSHTARHYSYSAMSLSYSFSSFSSGTGYGFEIKQASAKLYTPFQTTGTNYVPYSEREVPLPDTAPRNKFLIAINDKQIEYYVNDKREKIAPYKVARQGPFTIEVQGTATLENPRAGGT